MAAAVEQFKLPRGMGRLVRFTRVGTWTWQRWDRSFQKWTTVTTGHTNRAKAEQFVYQRCAVEQDRPSSCTRASRLFSTVAEAFFEARRDGDGCKRLRPASLKTLRTALTAFKNFLGPRFDTTSAEAVDAELLTRFVENEMERIAVEVANRHLEFILQILKFCINKGWLLEIPKPRRGFERNTQGMDETEPDEGIDGWPCPTKEQVAKILSQARPGLRPTGALAYNGTEKGRTVFKGINGNNYTDLFTTLCLTGMRIGEAIHLTWNDVDFTDKVIRIRPGEKNGTFWQPKTKFGVRCIAIVPTLELILRRLQDASRRKVWVFESARGTRLYAHNVAKRFREICDEIGFEKHFVVHSLRKFWASTVAQQGLDWKLMIKQFGHSDFDLILKRYYSQNDTARIVAETSKVDFGLILPGSQQPPKEK